MHHVDVHVHGRVDAGKKLLPLPFLANHIGFLAMNKVAQQNIPSCPICIVPFKVLGTGSAIERVVEGYGGTIRMLVQ
eukprot:scaffold7948_cov92-Amphora_coffeaeformis.AAC.1